MWSKSNTVPVLLNNTPEFPEEPARIVKIIFHVLTLYPIVY